MKRPDKHLLKYSKAGGVLAQINVCVMYVLLIHKYSLKLHSSRHQSQFTFVQKNNHNLNIIDHEFVRPLTLGNMAINRIGDCLKRNT